MAGQDIEGMRPHAVCRAGLERTFSDVTVCTFKLRTLESLYRGNATEASAWVYYIPTATMAILCYRYVVIVYNITRRGLACVAYPYLGAMREPENRDRRGEINSHVFFISHTLLILTLN